MIRSDSYDTQACVSGLHKTRAVGLFIALAGAPLFVVLTDLMFGTSPGMAMQVTLQLLYCALAAFLVWFVLQVEQLPLRSIGLRRATSLTVVSGIGLLAVISFGLPLLAAPLHDALDTAGLQAGLDRLVALPVWFRVLLGISGGAIEEIFYRGYAIERLATITGRPWLAGLIAAVIFALSHIPYWGLGFALAADLPSGLLMSAFYLWRRDLLANVFAHSTGLVIAMLTTAA